MLGVNIYDSDAVALPATGRTAQTSFVKGFFFLFFLLFVHGKAAGCAIQMKCFSTFPSRPRCQVRAA